MTQYLEGSEPEAADPPSTPAIAGLLPLAWRRKWFLALGIAISLALGGLYYAKRTTVYRSDAQVLVVKKRPDALPFPGSEAPSGYYDDYLATHQTLIKSPLIIGRAVKKRELQSLRSFAAHGDPAGLILGSLSVSRDSKDAGGNYNNVLNLSFRAPVAEECPTVLNALIDSYKEFLDETYRNVSDDTLELITRARDVLQKELGQKETAYRTFRQKSPLLWKGKDGTNLYQERLSNIESKRSALLVRRAEVQARLPVLEKAWQDSQAAKTQAPAVAGKVPAGLEEQLLPLVIQEQTLLEHYGKDHPEVQAVRRRMQLIRDSFARRSASKGGNGSEQANAPAIDSLEAQVQALRQELLDNQQAEQSLAALFQRQYDEARELRSYEVQDEEFRNDIARTQQLYDGIIKRLGEFNIVRDFGGYDARTISPPHTGVKVEPKPLSIFTFAACLGIAFGLGLAYLVDISDRSFRTPTEIRRRLGWPVVGHIPLFPVESELATLAGADRAVLDPALCTFYRPQSKEAEAYRSVRTALYFRAANAKHQLIQITSPNRADGKTTLAANLAVSMAQSGKRVLLVDADFRRPRLHKVFGLADQVGLACYLVGRARIKAAIQRSEVQGLAILPCGPIPPNPAELLTSTSFQEFLAVARQAYDYVLVDTPPLLAVTDPCVVAPRVDGVLLTIRPSKNGRPDAERAREVLATLTAPVIGVVVNGVSEDRSGFGYQHYRYAYGDGNADSYRNESPAKRHDFDQGSVRA